MWLFFKYPLGIGFFTDACFLCIFQNWINICLYIDWPQYCELRSSWTDYFKTISLVDGLPCIFIGLYYSVLYDRTLFLFLRNVPFLSYSFVWHGTTLFPTVICTCNFGPLFYIFFNFYTWGDRGGEVSDPTLGNRNYCIRYLYQGKNTRKNIFRVYFPSTPPILCYIFVNTLEMFLLPVNQDSILIAQHHMSLPLL